VDDPNILAIAKQISRAPLDPYGFTFNWTGTSRPAFEILANPPLAPLFIAGWAAIFGWSEISLHVLTLLFALVAIGAFFWITRDFLATALLAASPAFFISTQTVMPDMLMLALLMISVATAMRGWYALAVVAGALTPIAKYNGVVAVALLVTIAIVHRKRALAIVAASPIAGLAIWSAYSMWQYGAIHLFIVSEERRSNFAHTLRDLAVEGKRMGAIDPFISVLVLAGLAVIPFGWQLLMRRRYEWALALVAALAAFFVAHSAFALPVPSSILFGIGIAAGIRVLAFVLGSRNPLAIVWLVAVLVFQAATFAVATRYLLPIVPAALLAIPRVRRGLAAAAIVVSLIVAIPAAIGEYGAANCYRDFSAKMPHRAFYFAGHWGFQHYAALAGGTLIDVRKPPAYKRGDVVVIASHAFPSPGPLRFPIGARAARLFCTTWFPLHTISCGGGASYNVTEISGCRRGDIFLPFAFSKESLEEFDVFVVQ
ncbi:MAG TPA: hypothetical protein VJ853_06590, partial [Thermoanaerobaculia bacterium]|nr:hypothetical protein [Thermoanaerobaculia bacterium]